MQRAVLYEASTGGSAFKGETALEAAERELNERRIKRMKRTWVILIILLVLLLTACNSNNEKTTVKVGTYVLEQTETIGALLPYVNITDNDISFTYDCISSYCPHGTYTIEDDILTMITDENQYKYVFQVDEDKLIFQKNKSSEVNLTDGRLVINLTDNAIFKLKENKS